MLGKTLTRLANIRKGLGLAEGEECYDEAELVEFAMQVLFPLLWAPPKLRRRLQELRVNIIPNNFYSEIPDLASIEESFASGWDDSFDYIFDRETMWGNLEALMPFAEEFDPPTDARRPGEYAWNNPAFTYCDAMAYYSFIRQRQPRTIVEIGCGWSTLVADLACKKNGCGRIICIDPHPPEFMRGLDTINTIIEKPVQSLDTVFFNQLLADGDFLFIDSTHTVKHNSDCVHLYLKILPRIAHSILVQVHDVFLPYSLPLPFLRDQHIYWTEQYLVMAYLINNTRTEVIYGSRYHYAHSRERLTAFMRGRFAPGGASLWFSQTAAPHPTDAPR
jgi:predicted O-methyltransferase YrrM